LCPRADFVISDTESLCIVTTAMVG